MAFVTETHRKGDLIERLLDAGADLLHRGAERHAQRRVYRQTLRELSVLSHRELADLGIARAEIGRIAWQSAYGASAR